MPNPKTGTVTFDVARAVQEIKAGKVEFRTDKTALVHVPVGKISFPPEKLIENATVLITSVVKAKPSVKGKVREGMLSQLHHGPRDFDRHVRGRGGGEGITWCGTADKSARTTPVNRKGLNDGGYQGEEDRAS